MIKLVNNNKLEMTFDYIEAKVCKECEKGFIGDKLIHCPFCGSQLTQMKGD